MRSSSTVSWTQVICVRAWKNATECNLEKLDWFLTTAQRGQQLYEIHQNATLEFMRIGEMVLSCYVKYFPCKHLVDWILLFNKSIGHGSGCTTALSGIHRVYLAWQTENLSQASVSSQRPPNHLCSDSTTLKMNYVTFLRSIPMTTWMAFDQNTEQTGIEPIPPFIVNQLRHGMKHTQSKKMEICLMNK